MKQQTEQILEYKLNVLVDMLLTVVSLLGVLVSRYIIDSFDLFLLCSTLACFNFHNLADSHEQYEELIDERTLDKN